MTTSMKDPVAQVRMADALMQELDVPGLSDETKIGAFNDFCGMAACIEDLVMKDLLLRSLSSNVARLPTVEAMINGFCSIGDAADGVTHPATRASVVYHLNEVCSLIEGIGCHEPRNAVLHYLANKLSESSSPALNA